MTDRSTSSDSHLKEVNHSEHSEHSAPSSAPLQGPNALGQNTSQRICRICLSEAEPGAPLMEPCNCRGEFAFCHATCISKWVEVSKKDVCDFCKFEFNVTKTPKGLLTWLTEEPDEANELFLVVIFFYFGSYLLFLGAIIIVGSNLLGKFVKFAFLTYTLIGLCIVILVIASYLGHMYFTFQRWQRTHFHVVVLPNKKKAIGQTEATPASQEIPARSTPALLTVQSDLRQRVQGADHN